MRRREGDSSGAARGAPGQFGCRIGVAVVSYMALQARTRRKDDGQIRAGIDDGWEVAADRQEFEVIQIQTVRLGLDPNLVSALCQREPPVGKVEPDHAVWN